MQPKLCLTWSPGAPTTQQLPPAPGNNLGCPLHCCPPACVHLPEPQAGAGVRLLPRCGTGRAPPGSSPFSQAPPEAQTPEQGILRGPGYCWGSPRPHPKPHTEGLPCRLGSGPASLQHCPLSTAVWDNTAHGVRTNMGPVMALLTSLVVPEVPGPTPQLGLVAESGKEGISNGRRFAAESGFQPSQHPAPRATKRALSPAQAVGKHGPGSRTPSARQLGLCRGAGTASTTQPGVAAEHRDQSTALMDSEGTEPQGLGGPCPPPLATECIPTLFNAYHRGQRVMLSPVLVRHLNGAGAAFAPLAAPEPDVTPAGQALAGHTKGRDGCGVGEWQGAKTGRETAPAQLPPPSQRRGVAVGQDPAGTGPWPPGGQKAMSRWLGDLGAPGQSGADGDEPGGGCSGAGCQHRCPPAPHQP